jgi:hypothetical protein
MFRSVIARFAGVAAAAALGTAIIAGSASAYDINPCQAGPQIGYSNGYIDGACFAPNSQVAVLFSGTYGNTGETTKAVFDPLNPTFRGTFSVPVKWVSNNTSEQVVAYSTLGWSNTVTVLRPIILR